MTGSAMGDTLAERIERRTAEVGVVGLGYVGLPLAVALAEAGFRVTGIDIDERKVRAIRAGQSPILDVADALIAPLVAAGRLRASESFDVAAECDALFVCVPTPFDANKTPDLRAVHAAADGIGGALRPGQLVVLQSTTYPGTTEEVIRPRLEAGGLKAGQDFFLAFCPERIDPGVPSHTVTNTPKVVGGLTPTCAALAAALLGALGTSVQTVSSPRVAEMTKLLENIFRSVNIALVNELSLLCERMGIDVWEVIDAAASKPFGFMPFRPGAGVGGHCIPIDPYYLAWKAREFDFSTRFIELAADINQGMPYHVVNLVSRWLDAHGRTVRGAQVLVLGVAFKPEVDDARHSPAGRVIELLLERGASVRYHDPYVPRFRVGADVFYAAQEELESSPLTDALLAQSDVVVIVTGHRNVDYTRVVRLARLVVDTANVSGPAAPHVVRLGAPRPAAAHQPDRPSASLDGR
jgi:UDP-N-acetyl-D-glucosamine dehydrogenase